MATLLQLQLVLVIALLPSFWILKANGESSMEAPTNDYPFFDPSIVSSPAQAPPPSIGLPPQQEMQSPMAVLESILTNLGFQELAVAVPSLSDSAFYTWNGPSTIFAPTDNSIRSCGVSCSVPQLLREHIVPGIFSLDYLKKLAFGTKLETMSTGRCITVTSASSRDGNDTIVYIGGVEITQPDFFYNGLVVVHRLEGFISPLSPFSCHIERMTPLSFPPSQSENRTTAQTQSINTPPSPAIMRLMLKDAMLRLHNNGFTILSLALRIKYAELVNLQNFTVFALDDAAIFSGGHAYLNNFRFHIVPNRLLMSADLMRLPTGTTLATMDHGGDSLMVTTGGSGGGQMRINYVRIKTPDLVYNLKIAVHSVYLPFPHLHPATVEFGGMGGNLYDATAAVGDSSIYNSKGSADNVAKGSCAASDKGCVVEAASAPKRHRDTL
ncbi:Transmembrane protein [Thalictrum thalictroides]|uniref:Transmembrane protein n=1 Tax=Thalictrum thalictroides TaxID=46969 RepID=A0A7J6V5X6_THATH|nr:Transmembrane protein [Thalictrum thalictroides]